MMFELIKGLLKCGLFGGFLLALAGFSGIATVRYLAVTGEVEVPELIGKDLLYARDLLAERHLQVKAIEQQVDAKIPKDAIIAQDPPPGTRAQKNQTVRLILSKGAEVSAIPDVLGKRWQDAAKLLRDGKFRLGNVAYVHSAESAVDSVIAQTPLPNSAASVGGAVNLLVSLGASKKVMVMPDLVEEQLVYAQQVVRKLGLVVGKVERDAQYPDVPPNTIISQVPKPGTLVEEQNIVNFVVGGPAASNAPPPGEPTPAPAEIVELEYTVPPGRFEREVTVLVRNAEGVAEMYRQLVAPGNPIVVRIPVIGETVAEIYLDGMLDVVQRLND